MRIPDADTMQAWTALLTAYRRLTVRLDAELRAGAEMTIDDYDVLYQLRSAGRPLRMSDLAAAVLITRPSTTRLVERLVARGWVRRWHSESDRRVVMVELTPAGRRAQSRAGRVHLDGIARLVGDPLRGRDVSAVATALRLVAGAGAGEE